MDFAAAQSACLRQAMFIAKSGVDVKSIKNWGSNE
jgi:hypothetical protein